MFSIEEMVVKRLVRKTGFPIRLGAVTGNPLSGRLQVGASEMENTDDFPLLDFLSMGEVKLHFSPASLLGGTFRIKDVEIHLRQLTGVRAASGLINIERFRHGLERREEGAVSGKSGRRPFEIRRLALKVDQVVTLDYAEAEVRRREYAVNFHREFRNVTDWYMLASPLMHGVRGAGLHPSGDEIFATLLPEALWEKLEG